ncbi:DUF882 domain-containing protein [Rhizobium sp. B230/85]|uniref:DUF882 domain-containing protein n=1 Tax=unclassified Rhizobium TaxID=2613769 RepID=UPI001AD9A7A4|nr:MULTISPECIES: DUF882 domain-containing protein [unclassified Rhizobium]MBO9131761.1 DUF882 domain-containing protein [Rhizobium sp. B209b/85]QXZ95672.1 DUF882 domain-containing protein [Rhizobium sp. B230/85]
MQKLNGNSKRNGLNWRTVCSDICVKTAKALAIGAVAIAVSTPVFVGSPSQAEGETRSLKIYYVHTGEKAVITYKRNGKFDPRGLEQLNRILRDWRKNQPTKMNPRLFDLIWEVYRESGSHEFINVVCGFRSPDTNEMLRTRNAHTGVAKKSQHMLGNAMDFYIPDVKLAKLRELGMKLQTGGVGYYPTSGSPFVHMDVGGVRAWPRMDRQDLVRLFPNGKTMHIPADGKPLPGYDQAVADYKRRMSSDDIQVASVSPTKHRGFFATLFGGGGADEAEDNSDAESTPTKAVATTTSTPRQQAPAVVQPTDDEEAPRTAVASLNAPIPAVRPSFGNLAGGSDVASALVSPNHSAAQDALSVALPANGSSSLPQYTDLSSFSVPVPSLLGQRRAPGDAETQTASADPLNSQADSQLSSVPVPVERPAVAENLLASAQSDTDAEEDNADENALSPSVVAALEQHRKDEEVLNALAATPMPPAAQAIASVTPQVVPTQRPAQQRPTTSVPMQMAALAPQTKIAPSANNVRFYDAFDAPTADDSNIAAGIPTKGGRPSKKDAVVATAGRATLRTEPKLTEKMVEHWALSNARLETASRPVKAPRFVSQQLRAQPTTVYTEGFKQQTAAIDPERFNGSAVNFLPVKKFDTLQ